MAENLSVFDFSLNTEEMAALDQLGRDDPDMLDADNFGH
jgi:2,5-diketo-D-gluconate reductase A